MLSLDDHFIPGIFHDHEGLPRLYVIMSLLRVDVFPISFSVRLLLP